MTDNNTLSKKTYIFEYFLWGSLSLFCYSNLLFRNIEGMSYYRSFAVLLGMIGFFSVTGCIRTWKYRRNNLSIAVSLLAVYELYSFILFFQYKALIMGSLIFAWILSTLYSLLVCARNWKWEKQNRWMFLGVRTIIVFCFIPLVFSGTAKNIYHSVFSPTKTEAIAGTDSSEEYTIANQIDQVLMLQEENWRNLTLEERLNVMQTCANIEARYLGLPHELTVSLANLKETTWGNYSDASHRIKLNSYRMETATAAEMLNTVCHEAYHAFEHRLVELYTQTEYKNLLPFERVELYKQELENYISDGSTQYLTQLIESDARSYAETAVDDYYERIEEYLSEKGGH